VIGLIWGVWHFPLTALAGTTQAHIPFTQFVVSTVLLAVVLTWLYNASGGSVLVAALFHTVANLTGAYLPIWVTGAGRMIMFATWLVAVVLIVVRWGPATLARPGAGRPESLAVNMSSSGQRSPRLDLGDRDEQGSA
jgi:uncharacterized protein